MEVSSKGERIGIDVLGGCEGCTKLDDRVYMLSTSSTITFSTTSNGLYPNGRSQ